MKIKLMIVTINSWRDENSIGNTFSNWLAGMTDIDISNVFMREENPNNNVCSNYFRITEKMLIKNFFHPKRIGQRLITKNEFSENSQSISDENKMKRIISKHNYTIFYMLKDFLWSIGLWKNEKFKEFIKNNNPNIIFSFAMSGAQYYHMLKFLKKQTNSKIVLYISDNVYGKFNNKNKGIYNKICDRRFKKLLQLADKVYGTSKELSDVYSKEFDIDITPLYKGAAIDSSVKRYVNKPIKMVYAGNLLYGRLETLIELSNAINKINIDETKCELFIYSVSDISKNQLDIFKANKGCYFMGGKPYEEIKKIIKSSDIVLHVESFNQDEIEKVKFSFSTKIIDCLQSESVLLAIGPKGISSIEYIRNIEGATVIDDLEEIESKLFGLLKDSNDIIRNANKIKKFAYEHHDIEQVQNGLFKDFSTLVNK